MSTPRFDAEAVAAELNEMLAYARARVDPQTNEGHFRFGYNMRDDTGRGRHHLHKKADALRKILIDLGYVRNLKTRRAHAHGWWIKPDGQITVAQVQTYHDAKKLLANFPTETELLERIARLEAENEQLRRELYQERQRTAS